MSILIKGMDMPEGNSVKAIMVYSDGTVYTGHVNDSNYSAVDVPDKNVGDMISRQAAIKKIKRNAYRHTYIEQIIEIIKELPSAQPENTTWEEKEVIYIDEADPVVESWQSMKCNKCERYYTTPYSYYFKEPEYCPYCGRKTERRTDE